MRLACIKTMAVALAIAAASQPCPAQSRRSDGVNLRAPLDIALTLAGNFGELRRNHFHSGVDFKTQGRTGLPVYAVDDGYVSRATVSPWGFGRALYVTHPSTGLTTVYGHLEAFSPLIDRLVREKQYEQETFSIDVEFEPGRLPVKRGEQIALSGNAGSSGGPHLHFDVRDTASGDPLDPLEYYRSRVKDTARPEVRKLALYPAEGGTVNGAAKGAYSTPDGTPSFTAWGPVVPGIKAYDRMSGTQNIYGVKYLTLTLEGDTVYRRVIDRYSFDNTRAVHTIINNADLERGGEWIMTTAVPASRPLGDMIQARDNGVIDIDSTRTYNFKWILEDEHGNRAEQPFKVTGKRALPDAPVARGQLMLYDADNVLELPGGFYMEMPRGALYDNTFVDVTQAPAGAYLSEVYTVGDPAVPLDKSFYMSVPLSADTLANKRQYCLVRITDAGKRSAESATYADGALNARPSRFGRYAVTADKTPPVIQPLEKTRWATTKNIRFKITDNLSGVDTWRAEIDGKWALFELDGKTSTLWFKLDPDRFPGKSHDIKLTVTDACGNTSTFTGKI